MLQTVLPREGQEFDLSVRDYILRIPYGIFCRYWMLEFLNHPSNDIPLLLLSLLLPLLLLFIIITVAVIIINSLFILGENTKNL